MTQREVKLTAALLASRPTLLEHVRATGRIPEGLSLPGAHIGMRLLIERRGTDVTLTSGEHLVYEAIIRGGGTVAGAIRLVDPEDGRLPRGSD